MFQNRAIRNALAAAVGPAPWYWQSFPAIEVRGQECRWRHDEAWHGSVMLVASDDPERAFLEVPMYTRVFCIPPGLVGLWFDVGTRLRVMAVDPDLLEEFTVDPLPVAARQPSDVNVGSAALGEFTVDCNLEEGEHLIDVPLAFAGLDSMLLVGPYAKVQEAACAAIFEVKRGSRAGIHRVAVYPQKWFNRDDFDLGYQWITRVAREPATGRLIGDGIRVPPFVLREDGKHIDRWLPE